MELRDYLRGLRRHWLGIVLMTLVGLGAAYAWTLLQTPRYESSADGLVQTSTSTDTGMVQGLTDAFAMGKVPTYLEMATWEQVAQLAVDEAGLDIAPSAAASLITVTNPAGTPIIRVTAQGGTPEGAAALAEAWLTALTATIDTVDGDETPGSAPITIRIATTAAVPTEPIFPDVRTALLIGGVLGLGFGIAFALVRTASDRRIRVADDVEARTHIPVVGTIPISDALSGENRLFDAAAKSEKGDRFAVAEALRSLRTNLQFMDVDNPPRTIVVTSPLPGDGKSTIACTLALTLAANGKKVVLLDGDLRRSMVAKTMGLPGGAGLSDVLSGRAEISEVLQRTPRSQNLFVLTAGSVPPNPSEVLSSERMRNLLKDLSAHAMVIIDAPPLLPVTDGAVLTQQSDGALLVVSAGKTTYDLVDKALDTLRKSSGRALGVVLNRAPLRGLDASPYSYEYRREYGSARSTTPDDETNSPEQSASFDLDNVFGDASASEDAARQRVRRS